MFSLRDVHCNVLFAIMDFNWGISLTFSIGHLLDMTSSALHTKFVYSENISTLVVIMCDISAYLSIL